MNRPRKSRNSPPDLENDYEEAYYNRQEELSEMDREDTSAPKECPLHGLEIHIGTGGKPFCSYCEKPVAPFIKCEQCPTPFECIRIEICKLEK